MPAPALMTIAMPAMTAKAANRLPLTPHFGRPKPPSLNLPMLNRNAIACPALNPKVKVRRQYRDTRLTKSGKPDRVARFLCSKKQKGRRYAGLSVHSQLRVDQYFATTGPPKLKR